MNEGQIMATYTLPISSLTHVEIGYQPPLLAGDSFARGLIVGSSSHNRSAANQFYGIYKTIDAVAADYGDQVPEYLIAKQYFAQIPHPKDIMIATVGPNIANISCAGAHQDIGYLSATGFTQQTVRIEAVLMGKPFMDAPSINETIDTTFTLNSQSNSFFHHTNYQGQSVPVFGITFPFINHSQATLQSFVYSETLTVRLKLTFESLPSDLVVYSEGGVNPTAVIENNTIFACLASSFVSNEPSTPV